MAKKSIIAREKRRRHASSHASSGREKLRKIIKSTEVDYDEKMLAVTKLNKKRRNQSAVRQQNRCHQCGRAHGVYRLFKLCRLCLRKAAMRGLIPGLVKSSW